VGRTARAGQAGAGVGGGGGQEQGGEVEAWNNVWLLIFKISWHSFSIFVVRYVSNFLRLLPQTAVRR